MHKLEIDLGNSFAKWRISSLGKSGRAERSALTSATAFPTDWIGVDITAIWLASVLSELDTEAVISAFHKHFGCEIHRAYSSDEASGVINGYAEPKRLGVDRWLALLAARQRVCSDVIVADAGTAITLDLLTEQGQHLGGYVLAGVARQAQSLWSGTGRVQVDSSVLQPRFTPGVNTQACVEAAIAAAIAGLCISAQLVLPDATWCLTGGDAHWLEAICNYHQLNATHHPDLVLDGLAWCRTQIHPAP
ncbi:MAG TPA: type III pantothenate kinase [Cellvibrionaceae bacterium]